MVHDKCKNYSRQNEIYRIQNKDTPIILAFAAKLPEIFTIITDLYICR